MTSDFDCSDIIMPSYFWLTQEDTARYYNIMVHFILAQALDLL